MTRAVHHAGGRILLQLWHVGRISHPSLLAGALPVAPSALAPTGNVSLVRPETPFVTPRALDSQEIPQVIEAFRSGAQHAQAAGFDGVELHAANGYLLDQFLQDGSNRRADDYGGTIENRARLLLDTVDAVATVWGADRVGVHLAPRGDVHSMGDTTPTATFVHVATELGRRRIAFICAREYIGANRLGPTLKAAFGGVYIANENFTQESAEQALGAGEADAVAFGKLFIANPDLPHRFAAKTALNALRAATLYSGGPEGYTDYPAL